MRFILDHPFRGATISLAACAAFALLLHGTGIEGLQAVARYTGRAGLLWFALVFSVSPWMRVFPGPLVRAAMQRRRQLGLAFGYHHFVHLAALLAYLSAAGKDLAIGRAAGGATAYLLLALMMLTSTDAAVKRLGPANWKRLHRTGLWVLWLVFAITYTSRILGKVPEPGGGMAEFVPCLAILLAATGLRVTAARR